MLFGIVPPAMQQMTESGNAKQKNVTRFFWGNWARFDPFFGHAESFFLLAATAPPASWETEHSQQSRGITAPPQMLDLDHLWYLQLGCCLN